MIDINTFLANHNRIQSSTTSVPASESSAAALNLHRDLRFAMERGWLIEATLSHSKFAFGTKRIALPTCDPEQVALLSQQYPRCNWTVDLKGSRLCILSVQMGASQPLRCLCEDNWAWRGTSCFRDDKTLFFVFRYCGERLRHLGHRFDGIKVHIREQLLIPPSWFASGTSLIWINRKQELHVPIWLLDRNTVSTSRPVDTNCNTPTQFDISNLGEGEEDVFGEISSVI